MITRKIIFSIEETELLLRLMQNTTFRYQGSEPLAPKAVIEMLTAKLLQKEFDREGDVDQFFNGDMLIDTSDVLKILGIKKSQFYVIQKNRMFLEPIRIGKSVRWRQGDVKKWIENMAEQSKNTSR
jgi:predicted DNA-binding transcriptional regulator AlpA